MRQNLPPDFEETLVTFQHFVIFKSGWKRSTDWVRSATPIRGVFDVSVAYTVNRKGAKQVKVKTADQSKNG